jgi:hypothetical protein
MTHPQKAYADHCCAAKEHVEQALNETLTLGAEVEWNPEAVMHPSNPPLGVVYADNFGRLWRQTHHEGRNTLICVLDTRAK